MSIYDIYNRKLIEFISEKKCDLSNSNLSNIAKNGNIWTQFPKTLEQCLHFYLNTNFGDYLNTFFNKPKNKIYLR